MNRRETLKLMGSAALAGVASATATVAWAAMPTMVTVVKIAGIPQFNAVEKEHPEGREGLFSIDATMVGPANIDPAQQVKLHWKT